MTNRRPAFDLERRVSLPPPLREPRGASARVRDIVPLSADGSRVLVTTDRRLVAVVDVARAELARTLREASSGVGGERVGAIVGDRVVLWGNELVEARDLATGAALWSAAEGDHNLDFSDGDCFVPTGSSLIRLPNGYVFDVRDGEYVPVEPPAGISEEVFTDDWSALPDPERGLLVALGGHLWRWDPTDAARPFERLAPTPPRVIAMQRHRGALYLVADDGSVWHTPRPEVPAERAMPPLVDARQEQVGDLRLTFVPERYYVPDERVTVALAFIVHHREHRTRRERLVTGELGAPTAPVVRFDAEWWVRPLLAPVAPDDDVLVFDLAGALCVGNPRSTFSAPLIAATHDAGALALHGGQLLVGDRDCLRLVPVR